MGTTHPGGDLEERKQRAKGSGSEEGGSPSVRLLFLKKVAPN